MKLYKSIMAAFEEPSSHIYGLYSEVEISKHAGLAGHHTHHQTEEPAPQYEYQAADTTSEAASEFVDDFAAGLVGGCTGLVFGHPFDTIKVRQQTSTSSNTSMMSCIKATMKNEGVKGLFRGMAFPLVGVGALNSIFFGVYGNVLKCLCPAGEAPTYGAIFCAGAFAGAVQAVPASPMELVKVKLQTQTEGSIRYRGPLHCIRHIHATEGLQGCFRGLGATVMREIPGFGIYITSYQMMCDRLAPEPGVTPSISRLLLAGGLAGIFSWTINIPIDIVKSRLQADNPTNPKYKGFMDCARKSYQAEGIRVFWRGLPICCIRAFPTNAVTFAVYSTVLDRIQKHREGEDES